jgi:hypothetical protein
MTDPVTHREIALLAELFKAGNDRLSGQIEGLRAHMDDALGRGVARMDRMDAERKTDRTADDQRFAALEADMAAIQSKLKAAEWVITATWALFGTAIMGGVGWLIKVAWQAAVQGAG